MTITVLRRDTLRPMLRVEIRALPRTALPAIRYALGQMAGIFILLALGAAGIAVRVVAFTPL